MAILRRPKLIDRSSIFDAWNALLAAIAVFHVFMAPYTKVEESFNTQAMHDILYYRHDISKYDHLQFPGVVPRTFLGAIVVSILSSPFMFIFSALGLPKILCLYTVRMALGSIVLSAIFFMRLQVQKQFGGEVSKAFALITATQFHLLYYATRPLPNIFALALVTFAYSYWMQGKWKMTLILLVFAAAVFRCDVVLILFPIGLSLLMARTVSVWNAAVVCASTAVVCAGLTFFIDSIMWRRWVWPELEVLWFNSVLNRSGEWGVSPWHWYLTSALPRAMVAAYPLSILGIFMERRMVRYVIPVFAFIILYSKLPHKELRFILFAVPMLNLSAAAAFARIYNNRKKGLWSVAYSGCVLLLVASCGYTSLTAAASYANYPGGFAMYHLHHRDSLSIDVPKSVHVDVLPAMTGISRFCEKGYPWSYSKEEGLTEQALAARNFTYLLSGRSEVGGYRCLKSVDGFSRVKFQLKIPPVILVKEEKVYIFERTKMSE